MSNVPRPCMSALMLAIVEAAEWWGDEQPLVEHMTKAEFDLAAAINAYRQARDVAKRQDQKREG